MKKSFWFFIILIVAIVLVVSLIKQPKSSQLSLEIISYNIENKTFSVYVADTLEKRVKGLSEIFSLDADGMLFIFSDVKNITFWNNNTHLNLELWWIKDNRVLKKDFLPSIDRAGIVKISSPSPVEKVLELVQK